MIPRIHENLPKELNECVKCHFVLPLSEFGECIAKKNGLQSWCRKCISALPITDARRAKIRARYKLNPELTLKRIKRWQKKNPENYGPKHERKRTIARHGIDEADYEKLLQNQNYKCAICGIPQLELTYPLHIDHCHITGKVRGLLCRKCNYGVGYFGDNIAILENAIKYLGMA